ncbi:unnamed protein product [Rotaria sordida]|uniref:Prohibitin n=1 Tax=Rotaria sordida TaxID=392033 RepID=A0A816A4L1_9BILA|nr:unnamed protein product [Rotaria sordida]CAF1592660.1 unnamed protein product [Rotaria sordida]
MYRYDVEYLFRFYTYGIEKHFYQHVFEDFQQETLCDHEAGQLYGLEKFWAFLKYSRQKPKINRKLEEILKNYKNLEDFRVGGASFPQQFFPTKSNYTFEAIAAAVAKNSDTSNSLKPNGEQYLNGAHIFSSGFRFIVLGRIDIGLGIGGGVINSMLYNDLQTINITLRILYRPRAELSPKIFLQIWSQFDAIELITQRTLISQRNNELLTERAAQFGLLLDDISIIRYDKKESRTHLSFRPEFTSAVELKQVAQQDVGKQRFLVEKTEQSRRANVIAAEGDTRAADLIGKVLDEADDDLIELRRIEATEDIANQLSKSRNSVYLPHGPQILLNITGAMQ